MSFLLYKQDKDSFLDFRLLKTKVGTVRRSILTLYDKMFVKKMLDPDDRKNNADDDEKVIPTKGNILSLIDDEYRNCKRNCNIQLHFFQS